jgi:replication factor A1
VCKHARARAPDPATATRAQSLRVGDFNGKTLGSLGSSSIAINPDRPEAGHLRAW